MDNNGKSFDAAQRAYDNMEHPDYYAEDSHEEEEEQPEGSKERDAKAWVRLADEDKEKAFGKYMAEGYCFCTFGKGVILNLEHEAYGNTPVDALQNLRAELAIHLPKLQKQLVDAIEKAREAL